ncbi:UPF0481 protein At3g47200-like isoform X2 [Cornus florida]|uniref:UPF0481 protein At3g47200-like isoform X2 n=1 Tax=Cornus florida TaxID=4283 RepID=UPI00289C7145|nr:UPF0481 protein At3g47200-like isoform X2 [Cornus florida]
MESESRSRRLIHTDHVALEIVPEDNLVFSIKEKIERVALTHSICRVPDKHSNQSEDKYVPKLVSIGPLHHGEEASKAMEDNKWCYLNTLLNRKPKVEERLDMEDNKCGYLNTRLLNQKPNVEASLDSCVKALRELENKARKCYGEKFELGSDEFVQMMLVDGCFIIEILFKYSIKGLRRRDDPFFITKERFLHVRSDMLLLENQIPFFILQRLFSLVPIPNQCTQSLVELALRFFKKLIPGNVPILQGKFSQDFNHLLDLVLHFYLPTYAEVESISGAKQSLANAKKLQKAGISFERANRESLLDMKFSHGVLKMPPLKVDDYTEVVLRNLIALEHCYCDRKKYITSYAGFVKSLIQSKEDLRLLYQTRIIANKKKEWEDILNLFKKLHGETDVKEYYYNGLCEQVNGHGKKTSWQAWLQSFRKTPLAVAGDRV